MKQYQAMTFVLTEDKDDVFLTTLHETSGSASMSIHTATPYEGFSLEITQAQAEDLISKLQKSIINLEVARRREFTKEEVEK